MIKNEAFFEKPMYKAMKTDQLREQEAVSFVVEGYSHNQYEIKFPILSALEAEVAESSKKDQFSQKEDQTEPKLKKKVTF